MKSTRHPALSIALLACSAISGAKAQNPPPSPEQAHALAVRRAATLTHGMNLSGWFGSWGDYSPEHSPGDEIEAAFPPPHST